MIATFSVTECYTTLANCSFEYVTLMAKAMATYTIILSILCFLMQKVLFARFLDVMTTSRLPNDIHI